LKDNSRKRRVAAYDQERKHDAVSKLYNCAAWIKLKQLLRNRGNVICQRIVDGEQCTRLAEINHHLISPRVDMRQMYNPRNIVGVCRQCHPTEEGTPDWIEGRDYVATVWSDVYVGK